MKNILGLDLGTNSIGWALISVDTLTDKPINTRMGEITAMGSRIIPTTADVLKDFNNGASISATAERTEKRGVRRLFERRHLRRNRLHIALNHLGMLPKHYANCIDFETRKGQFKKNTQKKLAYKDNLFLFEDNYTQMLSEFQSNHPSLKIIPKDWTIYYLRKKALTQKISLQELAWILLQFNQKRGYEETRSTKKETPEKKNERKEFKILTVNTVETKQELINGEMMAVKNTKGNILYRIYFTNGWYRDMSSPEDLSKLIGSDLQYIVTTKLNKDGSEKLNKDGEVDRSYKKVNLEEDWIAIKKKTEGDLALSGKTVGEFIYDALLDKPKLKIRGHYVQTIDRDWYLAEMESILEVQTEFHPELSNELLRDLIIQDLYPSNTSHQNSLKSKSISHILARDIMFYHRPLKSKKSSIADCPYESRYYKDTTGKVIKKTVKVIHKSHPLYQEFRLWQWIDNLKIVPKDHKTHGTIEIDSDTRIKLFDYLTTQKEIKQNSLLKFLKIDNKTYQWNYPADKAYPCYETRNQLVTRMDKAGLDYTEIQNILKHEEELWHLIYSIDSSEEFNKALTKFATKYTVSNPDLFVEQMSKHPTYNNEYGAYSVKAIKKLLVLMRSNKYWSEQQIHSTTQERIQHIMSGELDESISNRVRQKAIHLEAISDFQGLPIWLANYIIYDRHSEVKTNHWTSPNDITHFLTKEFKQHALNNPIVEKVIRETLQVVKDIWIKYGDGQPHFFHEIHLELGTEMKNSADKRKRMQTNQMQAENENLFIRSVLRELSKEIDVRHYSPKHQELMKIYHKDVVAGQSKIDDDISQIIRKDNPTTNEVMRYKLWVDQKYLSPYTQSPIALSDIFSNKVEIEHIIPRSRYFDDSFSNKVLCETEVNKDKDNQTALQFIKNNGGKTIQLSKGRQVVVSTEEQYTQYIQKTFSGKKQQYLLSEDVPDGFINRQLNDTRYISKFVKSVLGNIVREQGEQEATPKRLIPMSGAITSRLKREWGLNQVWDSIVADRFTRLNEITQSSDFAHYDSHNHLKLTVPKKLEKGFNKKRIDHRHHALDALVIACTTRSHIQYLNTLNAKNYALGQTLRKTKTQSQDGTEYKSFDEFYPPWEGFVLDAKKTLSTTLISTKKNTRILTKTNNIYWTYEERNGKKIKVQRKQTKGDMYAVRKPLHAETYYGKRTLVEQKLKSWNDALKNPDLVVKKITKEYVLYALELHDQNVKKAHTYIKKNPLIIEGEKQDKVLLYNYLYGYSSKILLNEKIKKKQIEKIMDGAIKHIVKTHLANYEDNISEAFSEEGLTTMNTHITELNNGKAHLPIKKITLFTEGTPRPVGTSGNNHAKMVKAAKGTNLYFAIYQNTDGKRSYKPMELSELIERTLQKLPIIPEKNEQDIPLLFYLNPNDMVYMPTEEELENPHLFDHTSLTPDQATRVYEFISYTGNEAYFRPQRVATPIYNKIEFEKLNKVQMDIVNRNSIKQHCWKLEIDRLGNITRVIR